MSNVDVPHENDSAENEIESPVNGPTPDWMKMATSSSSTSSLTEENMPSWLKDIQSGQTVPSDESADQAKKAASEEMSDLERLLAEEGVDLNTIDEARPEGSEGMSARDWMIATSDDEMIRNRVGADPLDESPTSPLPPETNEDPYAGMSDLERLLAEEGVDLDSVAEARPEGSEGMSARDWMISTSDDEMIRNRVGAAPVEAVDETPVLEPETAASFTDTDGMVVKEDLPDWLQDIDDDDLSEFVNVDDEDVEKGVDEGLPDWLSDIEDEEGSGDDQDNTMPVDEDLPDWLSDMEDEDVTTPQPVTSTDDDDKMIVEEDLPDWLQDVEPESASTTPVEAVIADTKGDEQFSDDDDLSDWLRDVEEEVPTTPPSLSEVADDEDSMVVEEDLPEWLQEIEGEESPVLESTATVEPAEDDIAADDDLPDWLRNAQEEDGFAVDSIDNLENLPDWLKDVQEEAETESAAVPVSAVGEGLVEEDELPDWLQEVQDETQDSTFSAESVTTFADDTIEDILVEEDELPDWLSEPQTNDEEPFEPSEPSPDELEEMLDEDEDEDLPDWLREVQEEAVVETSAFDPEVVSEKVEALEDEGVIEEEELPDWLMEMETETDPDVIATDLLPEPDAVLPTDVAVEIKPQVIEPELVEEAVETVETVETVEVVEEIIEEPAKEVWVEEPQPTPVLKPVPDGMPDWLRKLREGDREEPAPVPVVSVPEPVPLPQPVAYVQMMTPLPPQPQPPAPEPELRDIDDTDLPKDTTERLKLAQKTRDSGDIDKAALVYTSLISSGAHLDTIIGDMELAIKSYPSNYVLYQVMGDAMMKDGRLQGALDFYRKALEKLSG